MISNSPNLKDLKRAAIRHANDMRAHLKVSQLRPLCPFDAADSLAVDLRFIEGSSFEGMFIKSKNLILLPTERPYMRRIFACAHELGHWHYGHSSKVDLSSENEILGDPSELDEIQANTFASHLLVPNRMLRAAISDHSLERLHPDPLVIYEMSCWAGVSMRLMLRRLSRYVNISEKNLSLTPRKVTSSMGIKNVVGRVLLHLRSEPDAISMETGDHLVVPHESRTEHFGLKFLDRINQGDVYHAIDSGVGLCMSPSWDAPIRIMRQRYVGISQYRNLAP